jgi:hypothetical protein
MPSSISPAKGKYEGDFIITEIGPSTYNRRGRTIIEIRARLDGMTSNIDPVSRDEANRLSPQEVDPVDEKAQTPVPATSAPVEMKAAAASDPLVDTTPFSASTLVKPAAKSAIQSDAAALSRIRLFSA